MQCEFIYLLFSGMAVISTVTLLSVAKGCLLLGSCDSNNA